MASRNGTDARNGWTESGISASVFQYLAAVQHSFVTETLKMFRSKMMVCSRIWE